MDDKNNKKKEDPNRFLVVEDSPMTAAIIKQHLEEYGAGEIRIVDCYEEALATVASYQPSVAICDVHLNGKKTGIDFALKLRDEYLQIAFLFISADTDDQVLLAAQETNPISYITKPFTKEQFIAAVKFAVANQQQNNPKKYNITARELDVLRLVGSGMTNMEIGDKLCISHHAVDSRRRKILEKLEVININQALHLAVKKGWV